MPGGFELYNHTNKRCDVRTTTGESEILISVSILAKTLSSIDIILPGK